MTSTEDPTPPVWAGRGGDPPSVVGASSGLCTNLGGGCAGGRRGAATWSGWGRASCRQQGEGYEVPGVRRKPEPQQRSTAAAVSLKMLRLQLVRMLMLPLLLFPLGQAAPKDGAARLDSEVQLLTNPFQPGPEQLRLLQNYLKGLERTEEDPEHMNREQVLLYLFALHDYDQSGQLDGLELLSMLTAALAPGAANFPINPVILVVDKVLETQDLDGDGFMTPAELINFPGEAPSHAEPLTPVLQELQSAGSQLPLAKNPSQPETQQALEPGEAARGQVAARSESLEPVQEAGHQTGTEGDTLSLGGESRGQVEAEDVPSPREDAGGQVEGRADEGGTKELPGEALETKNIPNEIEAHSIQLENDEI